MKVRLFASLRQVAGVREVELATPPATPLRAVVASLVASYPGLAGQMMDGRGALRDAVSILVDGRNARLAEGLDTLLRGDEEIAIFPPMAGGRRP